MSMNTMKSYLAKKGEVQAKWYLVDLTDKVLGRAATKIATILMGKHRPEYTPHVDTGEFVVVINAEKFKVTGSKKQDVRYEWYTGYPGGQKSVSMQQMLAKRPEEVIRKAVRTMLPKTKMGMHMITKLKVYAGSEHPHQAQNPQKLDI